MKNIAREFSQPCSTSHIMRKKLPHCIALRHATANFNKFDIHFLLLFLYTASHLHFRIIFFSVFSLWFFLTSSLFHSTCFAIFYIEFNESTVNMKKVFLFILYFLLWIAHFVENIGWLLKICDMWFGVTEVLW